MITFNNKNKTKVKFDFDLDVFYYYGVMVIENVQNQGKKYWFRC